MMPYKTRGETGYTALRRLRCRRMVLYGDWQQLYATVRCYTAGGRTIISSAAGREERVSETTTLRQRVGGWLREVIAPAAWAYTVVKLAIFDLDRAMLMAVAPTQIWL